VFMMIIRSVILLLYSSVPLASEVVDVSAKNCRHGLNQPVGGDFAVFIFCDDALGTQLGVIYQKPGVGPAEKNTDWSNVKRFWQEGPWMIDVVQIVWSESKDYMYLTTSPIYGDGSFYELDLRHRKATKLLDRNKENQLIRIDRVQAGTLWVNGISFTMKD